MLIGAPPLRVIAAAVVDSGQLLLISKRPAPDIYSLPSGMLERDEGELVCLLRQLREELDVGVRELDHLVEVHAPAVLERRWMHMTVYLTDIDGPPTPASGIDRLRWWAPGDTAAIAPAVRRFVLPSLYRRGAIESAS